MSKIPDQADVRRQIVYLKAEAAKIEMKCAEASVDFPSRPVLKRKDDEFESLDAMKAHVAALRPLAAHAEVILRARKGNLDLETAPESSLGSHSFPGESLSSTGAVSLLVAERDALKLQVAPLLAEISSLRLQVESTAAQLSVVSAERDSLKAAYGNFSKRLAGELSKHGIRQHALNIPQGDGRLSATDRVSMAKGQ